MERGGGVEGGHFLVVNCQLVIIKFIQFYVHINLNHEMSEEHSSIKIESHKISYYIIII